MKRGRSYEWTDEELDELDTDLDQQEELDEDEEYLDLGNDDIWDGDEFIGEALEEEYLEYDELGVEHPVKDEY